MTATGQSSWRVKAMCAGAGDYEDGSPVPISDMTIEESRNEAKITIVNPDFFQVPLSLPSCTLPYDQQLRIEMDRIAEE